jgi:hypothetical protein
MPVASSIQELIDALKTRKTNITRALDDLFGSQQALNTLTNHPHRADLSTPNVLGSNPGDPLPAWAIDELKAAPQSSGLVTHPLSDDEIAHIQDWPPGHKSSLAAALDAAIANGQPLQFYWELHGGGAEEMDTSVPGQVVFRSPQGNVDASGWFRFLVGINVRVGR